MGGFVENPYITRRPKQAPIHAGMRLLSSMCFSQQQSRRHSSKRLCTDSEAFKSRCLRSGIALHRAICVFDCYSIRPNHSLSFVEGAARQKKPEEAKPLFLSSFGPRTAVTIPMIFPVFNEIKGLPLDPEDIVIFATNRSDPYLLVFVVATVPFVIAFLANPLPPKEGFPIATISSVEAGFLLSDTDSHSFDLIPSAFSTATSFCSFTKTGTASWMPLFGPSENTI
jgi:hypothetical protein